MAGKNDRQRRQAREKYRRQQELRAARQRKLRRRGIIGVSAVLAAALIASLLLTFLPAPFAGTSVTMWPEGSSLSRMTARSFLQNSFSMRCTAIGLTFQVSPEM